MKVVFEEKMADMAILIPDDETLKAIQVPIEWLPDNAQLRDVFTVFTESEQSKSSLVFIREVKETQERLNKMAEKRKKLLNKKDRSN